MTDWLAEDNVERVLIQVTTDVGPIVGVDGRDYDLREGDVVTLPATHAGILLANDAAELLDASPFEGAETSELLDEAEAIADAPSTGSPVSRRWEFADWVWAQHREQTERDEGADTNADDGNLLAAAMGDGADAAGLSPGDTDASSSDTTSLTPREASALPLGQLGALDASDRRRAARQRGLDWPSTDAARDRLQETILETIREGDERVIDAPTSLGKTHTVDATRWGARDDVTGDRPVVHLLETRDARDEAIETAAEHGGEYHVLRARHEACPVAAGDHDPTPDDEDDDETDREAITLDGQPASEWLRDVCDGRGVPFSAAHRHLETHNDQGVQLPCHRDQTCPAIAQWDEYREGDHPLVIATHNFAHVPSVRMGTNVVVDEQVDFQADLTTDRVRRAVGAYLRHIDAPVSTWESFVQLALHDDWQGDAAAEREATRDCLDTEPDTEWYFETPEAHILAPALARAIMTAEQRGNGRRVGKTPYDPPRLDDGVRDDDAWNREWVTVVLDESNDVRSIRVTPDFTATRSLVGLDAHPALPVWQANTVPHIQRRQVLDPEERRLWRRYERGLRVVQVGDATRPLASGEYFDWNGAETLVAHLRDHYGDQFRTAITTKAVRENLESIMDHAGVSDPELMHYGAEKSRNDFARETIGYLEGCIDPGDDPILDLLAELDLDAEPERSDVACPHCEGDGCHECDGTGHRRAHGRGFVGDDAATADAILASVRENHVAQAAGRYAREPDNPDRTATVYCRTDAMPTGFADVQVPGVVWTFGRKQRRIVETLREATGSLTAREIAADADCSKQHVRQTLDRLADEFDDAVHAVDGAGDHGATLYHADGLPDTGIADLSIANSPVWDTYTYHLAIDDPTPTDPAVSSGGDSADTAAPTIWPPDPGSSGSG